MDENMMLEDLDFSVRTWKCLRKAGIDTLGELAMKTTDDLLAIPNMGRKSLEEIADKLLEFGVVLEGYTQDAGKVVYAEVEDSSEKKGSLQPGPFWSEVRNDFFESAADILPEEGDVLAKVSIDAWKTEDDNEEGCVIACVMLSKHGDVLVDYRDGVARIDERAQEAITEAKEQLRDYFAELEAELDDLNEVKNEKIVYFGEGHFVTRVALQDIAVAAAEDFVSKVNKSNGKRDSKYDFTFDFGSPWDEMNMYAEHMVGGDNSRKTWWTVCSIYTKGECPDMMSVQSVETTTDINDIAANILELVEELDCQIEIEYVQAMRDALGMQKSVLVDSLIAEAQNSCSAQLGSAQREAESECDREY